jgi:glycosyltransferase involved in cell wall biosynthesis
LNKIDKHILIAEPRLGGHHLTWLKYIVEDFLFLGCTVSLITDNRPKPAAIIKKYLGSLISKITFLPFYNNKGAFLQGTQLATMAKAMADTGADELFINNLDAIMSKMLRSAFIGKTPPKNIHGKINGIYFRPRFLTNTFWPINNFLKSKGFKNLDTKGWLNHIFLLDEYLLVTANKLQQQCQFHFLPDTWHGIFTTSQESARQQLDLPEKKYILLNYGIGDRRKGLYLVIEALLNIKNTTNIFLLCAGSLNNDQKMNDGLRLLVKQGKAALFDRYVTDEEEQLCFAACDTVLLPYIGHFGSSGVLSRATAAGKLVLASDEGLVGKRVEKHNLGLLFQTGSADDLQKQLTCLISMENSKKHTLQTASKTYSENCNRQAFRKSLVTML